MAPRKATDSVFVPSSGPKAERDKQIRRHVMLDVVKKRRLAQRSISWLDYTGPATTNEFACVDLSGVSQQVADEESGIRQHSEGSFHDYQVHPGDNSGQSRMTPSTLTRVIKDQVPPAPISLGAHRVDPFDTFPASGKNVEQLMSWHFFNPLKPDLSSWCYRTERSYRERSWASAADDPTFFHTLLCKSALRRAAITKRDGSVAYLFYKGKALQVMRERLSDGGAVQSDSFVAALTEHALYAAMEQDSDTALTHMQAAQKLFERQHFSGLRHLQWSLVVWNDLQVATAFFRRPMLSYASFEEKMGLPPSVLSPDLLQEAGRLASITLDQCHCSREEYLSMYRLFQRLHFNIGFAMPGVDVLSLVSAAYSTHHKVCTVVADLRGVKDSDPLTTSEMLLLGALSYLWSSFRYFGLYYVKQQQSLLTWIHHALSQREGELVDFWRRGLGLRALHWIIALVCVNTMDRRDCPQDKFATGVLRRVTWELGIRTLAGFKEALELFPWNEDLFGMKFETIWQKLDMDRKDRPWGALRLDSFDLDDVSW